MRGGNFLALLLILLAWVMLWLAFSGNYRATFLALGLPYKGGAQASQTPAGSAGPAA